MLFTYVMFPSDWDHSALPKIGYEVYICSHVLITLGKVIVCNGFYQANLKYMPVSGDWFC